jgi:hypothetical protein
VNPADLAPMKARAILLLACRRWLEERDAFEDVRARVTPETRAILDDPPVRTAWIVCDVFEDVYQAIAALYGTVGVREMGYEATRDSLAGTVLRPVLQAVAALAASPAGMFSRLNLSIRASLRGATTEYRPTSEHGGIIVAHYAAPLPPMVLQTSLGALRYTYDLCKVEGTITLLSVEDGGRASRTAVGWRDR